MRQRESAICLRTTDYSETSQVVHFLTRGWGLVHLIAKGSKRPKSKTGGAIDLLAEGDLVFSARSSEALGTLMEFSETAPHSALREEATRLNAALYMIELAEAMLAEADPHPEVFDLLHNSLQRLGQDDAPVAAVLAYTQWRLLRNVGLLGDVTACVSCEGPVTDASGRAARDVYFSSLSGGLLCGACEAAVSEKFRVAGEALAALAALAAAEAGKRVRLPESQARAAGRLLDYHITQQHGKRLRMARHVFGADA